MTHASSVRLALSLGLALSACNTQEIAPHQVAIDTQSDAGKGALLILFAPTDADFATEQARVNATPNPIQYQLLVDGQQAVYDSSGTPVPLVVSEGGDTSAGYWPPGTHHFEVEALAGRRVFSGDGPIVAGAVNRLYLLGPLDALQVRFTSYPFAPPAGSEHASAINLVRSGVIIEVVGCTDPSHCTAVSPPLALGDTFEGDFPLVGSGDDFSSLSPDGAGLGYRLVPSASLPAPPINRLLRTNPLLGVTPSTVAGPPDFVGAPIYLAPEGNPLMEWN